ncbi:HMG box domain-containing protein [Entamoeba marina]
MSDSKSKASNASQITKAIYIRWKTNKLVNERQMDLAKAKTKALSKWKKITDEKKQQYYKIACIECHLLNDGDAIKRKEECHPYLLFCKEHRDEVKAQGNNGNEVMKILSNKWNALSPKERKAYKDKATENKEKCV